MADKQEKKDPVYLALVDMSGKWGTVLTGKPVPANIIDQICGAEKACDGGLICLSSEFEKIVSAQKGKDNEAIKKGEDARKKLIEKRKADLKKLQLEKAGVKKDS